VYKCLQGVAPSYLADNLLRTANLEAWHRLHLASSPSLVVRCTRLSMYGNRAFPVATSRVWNSLPHHVTSAQSLPVFCSRLKSYLFRRSFHWLFCCSNEVTLVIIDTLIVLTYLLNDCSIVVRSNMNLWITGLMKRLRRCWEADVFYLVTNTAQNAPAIPVSARQFYLLYHWAVQKVDRMLLNS